MQNNLPTCSAIEFYEGPFAQHYDDFVRHGYLPDSGALYSLSQSFLTAALPARLLDVGIGSGLSALPFQKRWPRLQIDGVDGSRSMLASCRETLPRARLRHLDLETGRLPYDDGTFDITLSQGSLYMLRNAAAIVRDMVRVTRPGGLIGLNFEASADPVPTSTLNDASLSAGPRRTVLTYQHTLPDIMAAAGAGRHELLVHRKRAAMQKMNGSTLYFTDMLIRKR